MWFYLILSGNCVVSIWWTIGSAFLDLTVHGRTLELEFWKTVVNLWTKLQLG